MKALATADSTATWWARFAGLFVAVELLALQLLRARGGFGLPAVAAVLTCDVVLFAAVSYLLFARRHGGFRALGLKPRDALSGLLLAFAIHRLVAPRFSVPSLPMRGYVVMVALELLVFAFALVLAWRLVRSDKGAERPVLDRLETALGTLVSRALAAVVVAELRIARAGWALIIRKPMPTVQGFSMLETSSYRSLASALLMLSCLEAPALHLILHLYVSTHVVLVHAILFVLHAYTFVWILGDLRLLRESRHRCDDRGLHVSLGLRARAFVPYADIAEVRHDVPARSEHQRVSPMDTPNLVLILHRRVHVERMLRRVVDTHCLALYVDDPTALRAELARHL